MTFCDDLVKPIFFSLYSDAKRKFDLTIELGTFYSNNSSTLSVPFDSIKIDSYLAVLSEGNWYRVRVKSVQNGSSTTTRSIHVYFVDFGYEDLVDASEFARRVRILNERFFAPAQLAFGTILLDENDQKIDIGLLDTDTIQEVYEKFVRLADHSEPIEIFELSHIKKIGKEIIRNNYKN